MKTGVGQSTTLLQAEHVKYENNAANKLFTHLLWAFLYHSIHVINCDCFWFSFIFSSFSSSVRKSSTFSSWYTLLLKSIQVTHITKLLQKIQIDYWNIVQYVVKCIRFEQMKERLKSRIEYMFDNFKKVTKGC